MCCWFYILTASLVVVKGHNYGLLHFGQNETTLSECIENHAAFKHSLKFQNHDIKTSIANTIAERLSGNTASKTDVVRKVNVVIERSIDEGEVIDVLRASTLIKDAVVECSDEVYDNPITSSVREIDRNQLSREALPYFIEEIPEVGLLLDYILVNWPYSLRSMISTRSRRALLRSYVEDVLEILECAHSCNLMVLLQRYWSRRAQLFFDDLNIQFPYIDHIYTEDHRAPHTHGDTSLFVDRDIEYFYTRNRVLSVSNIDKVLNVGSTDTPRIGNDVFYNHDRTTMDSDDYYYEFHLNQLYRILLFFIELKARGIATDQDDIYEGPLPDTIIPAEIQAIVFNNNVYRNYLSSRTRFELRLQPENGNLLSLTRCFCYREEDPINIIMLFWKRTKNRIFSTTTTFTTTSTTSYAMSTTPKYEESKKGKGKFFKYFTGKCFLKSTRKFNYVSNQNINEKSNTRGSKELKNSQHLKTTDGYYGYSVSKLPEDDLIAYMRIKGTGRIFSNELPAQEDLRCR